MCKSVISDQNIFKHQVNFKAQTKASVEQQKQLLNHNKKNSRPMNSFFKFAFLSFFELKFVYNNNSHAQILRCYNKRNLFHSSFSIDILERNLTPQSYTKLCFTVNLQLIINDTMIVGFLEQPVSRFRLYQQSL